MEIGSLKQTFREKTAQTLRQKQIGRMKLGQLFSLPESEFRKIIKDLENTSLFKELIDKWKVISYRKFKGVMIPSSIEFKEEGMFSSDDFDLEELLHQNPKTIPLLQKIGQLIGKNRFNELLYGNSNISEIEHQCQLTSEEKEIFKDFLNRFELEKLTSGALASSYNESSSSPIVRDFKIASIKREGDKLIIHPHTKEDYLIKGKYSIDYRRYKELYQKKNLAAKELNRVSKIFKTISMINRRTTTIYQIIHYIKELQSDYLYSGDMGRLRALTRRELARRIGVHPSSITRVMANKSIGTPQKKELPLKFFFPSQKEISKSYLQDIIDQEKVLLEIYTLNYPYSDELIRDRLYQSYHIAVSRRAVAKYRKELNIAPSSRRMIKPKEANKDQDQAS